MKIKPHLQNVLIPLLSFTICFAVITVQKRPVSAYGKAVQDTAWKDAYMQIIKKLHQEDKQQKAQDTSEFMPYQAYTYALIYFDEDSIPELVAGLDGYWVSMYTYDKEEGKAHAVMDKWGYGAMGNAGYEYLPKKNCLRNYNSDFAGAVRYTTYERIKDGKMVSVYPKNLKEVFFIDQNHNGMPEENEYTDQPTYYYGKKEISEEKYLSYIISGKFKNITGTMTYQKIRKKLR